MILSTLLSLEACTHKVLVTEDDGFKYYKVTRNSRIGVKDLEGNVIVPIKMNKIIYRSRLNRLNNKERWFWGCCYDSKYIEIYNVDNAQCIISENSHYKVVSNLFRDKDYYGYESTSTFFCVRYEGTGNDVGVCDFSGKEIIPLKYESVGFLNCNNSFDKNNSIDRKISAKYTDQSDLIYCKGDGRYSVYDANGKCIIPDDYRYRWISKVNVPTTTPLLCCSKRDKVCDYRYSTSGELFLSGIITIKVINKKKELYYLALKDEDNDICYYDVFGKLIMKGSNLRYDDEKGFYYSDYNYDYDLVNHYINKRIDEKGHVVPVHTYSNSAWGWDDYGNQDVWMGSGVDGGYEWKDYSSSSNSYNGGSTTQPCTHKCGLCEGSGEVVEYDGASFGGTKYCNKCNKTVKDSHYHKPCPSCKGKGFW